MGRIEDTFIHGGFNVVFIFGVISARFLSGFILLEYVFLLEIIRK